MPFVGAPEQVREIRLFGTCCMRMYVRHAQLVAYAKTDWLVRVHKFAELHTSVYRLVTALPSTFDG